MTDEAAYFDAVVVRERRCRDGWVAEIKERGRPVEDIVIFAASNKADDGKWGPAVIIVSNLTGSLFTLPEASVLHARLTAALEAAAAFVRQIGAEEAG